MVTETGGAARVIIQDCEFVADIIDAIKVKLSPDLDRVPVTWMVLSLTPDFLHYLRGDKYVRDIVFPTGPFIYLKIEVRFLNP